jgi:hypothetical protein
MPRKEGGGPATDTLRAMPDKERSESLDCTSWVESMAVHERKKTETYAARGLRRGGRDIYTRFPKILIVSNSSSSGCVGRGLFHLCRYTYKCRFNGHGRARCRDGSFGLWLRTR